MKHSSGSSGERQTAHTSRCALHIRTAAPAAAFVKLRRCFRRQLARSTRYLVRTGSGWVNPPALAFLLLALATVGGVATLACYRQHRRKAALFCHLR